MNAQPRGPKGNDIAMKIRKHVQQVEDIMRRIDITEVAFVIIEEIIRRIVARSVLSV